MKPQQLLSDQRTSEDRHSATARFAVLNDLNLRLAQEHDTAALIDKVCAGARVLIGARFAVLVILNNKHDISELHATSGLPSWAGPMVAPRLDSGLLGEVYRGRRSLRLHSPDDAGLDVGLPDCYPIARAILAAPIMSPARCYGWLCLADKPGAQEFSDEDEQLIATLAAQFGRIYENGSLYDELRRHSTSLLMEMEERERASAELRESEERFRQLAESSQDVFFLVTSDFRKTLYISPAYKKIWGVRRSQVYERAMPWLESVFPGDALHAESALQPQEGTVETEYRIIRPDGSLRWIAVRMFPVLDGLNPGKRVVLVASDISDRKHASARIENLSRVYLLLSAINSLILRVTERGELLAESCRLAVDYGGFSYAWCGLMEGGSIKRQAAACVDESGALEDSARIPLLPEPVTDPCVLAALQTRRTQFVNDFSTLSSIDQHAAHVTRGFRSMIALPLVISGRAVGCLVLMSRETGIFDEQEIKSLAELCGDIAYALDHIEKAERLNYLAYYDALTGVANRTLFLERLALYVGEAGRESKGLAVLILDMQRYEAINDGLGRAAGDWLLRLIAHRLKECVGAPDRIARLGSDQFAVIMPDVRHFDDLAHRLEALWRDWLGPSFEVGGTEVVVSAKAGIAMFPGDGSDADQLLRHAEAALKKAKTGGEKQVFYTAHLSERMAERLAFESRFRSALAKEEFVLHYQPKVDVENGRLLGVEALIRWQSPELGLVSPERFIPLMEENGFIVEVGDWALRKACQDRVRWQELGLVAPRVAVNVSPVQLLRENFVDSVETIMRQAGGGSGIDIEVTESTLMENVAESIQKLAALRALGIGVALDDFGTGYSSLGYLTRMPVETLKIDRSFVLAMLEDTAAMTLVSTIISLAHALRLTVVAEGVESEAQAKILRLLRCDQMQGYLISRPLTFEAMSAYLQRPRR
jgi:diguanylate cyclase (GGDEF)-like protein/PAS domain S-box-containing protein